MADGMGSSTKKVKVVYSNLQSSSSEIMAHLLIIFGNKYLFEILYKFPFDKIEIIEISKS